LGSNEKIKAHWAQDHLGYSNTKVLKKKEKMELNDPKVFRAFVNYVLSLQDPDHPVLKQGLLVRLVKVLNKNYKVLANGAITPFSISVHEAARLFEIRDSDFRRLIVGRADRRKFNEFEFGIDYLTNGEAGFQESFTKDPSYFFVMTASCFGRASMKLRGEKGAQVRQYFNLINKGLLDKMGETLWNRLRVEPPEITKQKQIPRYIRNGYIPCNYKFRFWNPDQDDKFFYTGISADANTRYQNHLHDKPGLPEDWQRQVDPFPQSKEAMLQRYLADYRPAIAEDSRGYTDAYKDSPDIPKIVDFVERHQRQADIDWVREFPHLDTPQLIPETRSQCLEKQNVSPRKRRHSFRDGLVVRYDEEGKNPVVIQDTPHVREFALAEAEEESCHAHEDDLTHIENELRGLPKEKLSALLKRLSK
jgi:hypothetical protein